MRNTSGTVAVISVLAALFSGTAFAHPGNGVVVDSKGNVYYTDLKQVWRVSTDGRKAVAVANVHTHELWIDSLDNLYGEHLWYDGDRTGTWGHRVWKRAADGTVTDVIPSRRGFRDDFDDFHFVRDRSGAFYWMEGDSLVRTRRPGGAAADFARGRFNRAGWIAATPDGRVLMVDGDDLIALGRDGRRTVVARGVTMGPDGKALAFDRHNVEGICVDAAGAVYVAVSGRRCVKKASDGSLAVVDRSDSPWTPTGVAVGHDGTLWVLENSPTNVARLRHTDPQGVTRIF